MKLKKLLHRRRIVALVCLLLFVFLGYIAFSTYGFYIQTSENYRIDNIDEIKGRMNTLFYEINDFPEDKGNDMLYLSKLDDLHKLVNSDVVSESLRGSVENDFFVFMEVNPVYYQLRYIDETGQEIAMVHRMNGELSVAGDDVLENKRTRFYFKETMTLEKDEVYISPLDLNVEERVIENRGTKENPEYVPVIRYAMPLFNDAGARKGILIFNVYADLFLEDVRRMASEGEISFLVNNDGYYLAHPDRSKEYSFMFDGSESISSDYGVIGNEIINDFDNSYLENDEYVFTFRHLYPALGTFETYQGAKRLLGENPEKEYYWTLVSVSDKAELNVNVVNMKIDFVRFFLVSALIIVVMIILLLIILAVNGDLKGR